MSPIARSGYRFVASDGGVFNYGTGAPFLGSLGGTHLNAPIVGIGVMPAGDGYYLVASDGGVFAYGSAQFYGSMGGKPLNKPIVGIAVTPDGGGYWLVASDGGVFAFGDAIFYGSAGASPSTSRWSASRRRRTACGYWIVASDGGIFNYGPAAAFLGSTGGTTAQQAGRRHRRHDVGAVLPRRLRRRHLRLPRRARPVRRFYGSTGGTKLNKPIVGMTVLQGGYYLVGLRRRHLRLPDRPRRAAVLRLDRRHETQRADRGRGQLTVVGSAGAFTRR